MTRHVVCEMNVGKYKVLKLDGEISGIRYDKFLIDGTMYDSVPVYDAVNCISVEASESLEGKTVEFVFKGEKQ